MAVIGIDLGTTYCAAARFVNNNVEIIHLDGQRTLPSVVSVLGGGKIVVGWKGKRNQAKNPQDTVVEVKRKMGETQLVRLGQQEFQPQEISAMILREIKKQVEDEIGEEVTGAVITCPAYFKEPPRNATKEAGELAGLNVLRVLNEPTAAATAYGISAKDQGEENLFLVYDLGGGTFDVTVISMAGGNLDVIGTGGDPNLGGGNFDDRIVDWIFEHLETIPGYADTLTEEKRNALYRKLKVEAENAKIKLCGPPAAQAYQFQLAAIDTFEGKPLSFTETITMEAFESRIGDLVNNSLKWIDVALEVPIQKKNYTEADITEILLVGGSTRVPLVREVLKKRFPNTPLRGVESGINPDEIVAAGAALIAAQLDPEMEQVVETEIELVDVTGHSLSVMIHDAETKQQYLHHLILKDTMIPCKAQHRFASAGNFSTAARIKVFQGEGKRPDDEDVAMVGEFEIQLDPVQEPLPLDIGLELNEDGILKGHARNAITGQEVSCSLQYGGVARKSKEDVQRRKEELEARLKAGVGQTHNPLGDQPETSPDGAAVVAGRSAPGQQRATQAPGAAVDPRMAMNPVTRALYDQAMSSFAKIPADKRLMAMQMITEIENAAKAGDQNKMMQFYDPLNKLISSLS